MKKLAMEFLGTFFFVLTVALTANPLAIAAMLMAWVYIGGHISGGHYNPMVSLAVALRGRLSFEKLPYYIGVQILGGIAAFATTYFLIKQTLVPHPSAEISLLQAGIIEILLSFVFALVVLTVATTRRFSQGQVYGFAIGFTIVALGFLGAPFTGGLFNPAISIGATLFGIVKGMPIVWKHLGMYVIGSFAGGFLAAHAFRFFGENE